MEQITVRVPEDMLESLDAEAEERDRDRSEHIRAVLASRHEHDELRNEVNDLQTEVERLRREKRQVLEQREENQKLVRYVDHELEWRSAPLTKRLKWWVTGKPD